MSAVLSNKGEAQARVDRHHKVDKERLRELDKEFVDKLDGKQAKLNLKRK